MKACILKRHDKVCDVYTTSSIILLYKTLYCFKCILLNNKYLTISQNSAENYNIIWNYYISPHIRTMFVKVTDSCKNLYKRLWLYIAEGNEIIIKSHKYFWNLFQLKFCLIYPQLNSSLSFLTDTQKMPLSTQLFWLSIGFAAVFVILRVWGSNPLASVHARILMITAWSQRTQKFLKGEVYH